MQKPFIIPNVYNMNISIPIIGIDDSPYEFKNIKVPRVTHILSEMIHDDYLMIWSNNIGLYKHKKYKDVLDNAANIGTFVHNAIENYIKNSIYLDENEVPVEYKNEVKSSFIAFIKWWDNIKNRKIKILMQESILVCEYYGGTLDLLLSIDDNIYLVDFKTSNHLSYKYHLQLAAYRWILFSKLNINLDGCIVLRLDKYNKNFEENFLDLHNINDAKYMYECEQMFMYLLKSYYYKKYITNKFELS